MAPFRFRMIASSRRVVAACFAFPALLCLASVPALCAVQPGQSEQLCLAVEPASGLTVLEDVRGGVRWELGKVTDAAVANGGRSVVLSTTPASQEWIKILDGALAIGGGEQGYALVPAREGLLIPADGSVEFSHRFGTSSYEGCHMNLLGFVKQGAALLVTWEDPYITPELAKKKQGLTCSVSVRRPPHLAAPAPVQLMLTPLGKGDWNTIAAAYRRVAEDKGLAVTWRDKEARNPEARKLVGASNAKLWTCLARRRNEDSTRDESVEVKWTFDEAASLAEHLKRDLSIDRCMFVLGGWSEGGYDCRHPDVLPANAECGGNEALANAVRRIKALGYVAGFHDNYQDMYRDAKSWDPSCLQKKADGSPMTGGRWLGGRAWLVCSPETVRLACRAENMPGVQKQFAPQAYFIDTTYAVGPQECFDPRHPLNYASDIRWKQKLSDEARQVFGLFGSECGREWAIPHSDFFEGLSGVSGRYFHNLDPAALGATVVPLFEMVYHDCEAVYGKYGYNPDSAAEYVVHHALCGRTLNYHSFPNHLYWQGTETGEGAMVRARPSVVNVEPAGPRKFRIRYRWQVEGDCQGDWRVLVHFGKGEPIPFQNDHTPGRPVSTWRTGEVIEEGPFEVTVPESFAAGAADVYLGLFRGPGGEERAALPGCGMDRRVCAGRLRLKPAIAFEALPAVPLIGDPACFTRAGNGWAEGMCVTDRFVKNTHELLGPLAGITAHARLTRLEFADPDRSVRRAIFAQASGEIAATVTVNFGGSVAAVSSAAGGEVRLPPWGVLIESPGFVAFHALSWAGRQYQAPVLFAIRSENGRDRIFHGFGDERITWRGRELSVRRESEFVP